MKIVKKLIDKGIIRWILTIVLLWQVWSHSHLSVAATITLSIIGHEIAGINFNQLNKAIEELLDCNNLIYQILNKK